jgi:hypothetical protein
VSGRRLMPPQQGQRRAEREPARSRLRPRQVGPVAGDWLRAAKRVSAMTEASGAPESGGGGQAPGRRTVAIVDCTATNAVYTGSVEATIEKRLLWPFVDAMTLAIEFRDYDLRASFIIMRAPRNLQAEQTGFAPVDSATKALDGCQPGADTPAPTRPPNARRRKMRNSPHMISAVRGAD